jgi:hypothetical protein
LNCRQHALAADSVKTSGNGPAWSDEMLASLYRKCRKRLGNADSAAALVETNAASPPTA